MPQTDPPGLAELPDTLLGWRNIRSKTGAFAIRVPPAEDHHTAAGEYAVAVNLSGNRAIVFSAAGDFPRPVTGGETENLNRWFSAFSSLVGDAAKENVRWLACYSLWQTRVANNRGSRGDAWVCRYTKLLEQLFAMSENDRDRLYRAIYARVMEGGEKLSTFAVLGGN